MHGHMLFMKKEERLKKIRSIILGIKMEIFAYGEDALTLWSLKNKLDVILKKLEDFTPVSQCKIFYRPSFGRRGGENRQEGHELFERIT